MAEVLHSLGQLSRDDSDPEHAAALHDETGRRMIALGRQLSPDRIEIVVNKLRDQRELEAVRELATSTGVEIAGVVPYDERLVTAEHAGLAPLDFDPHGIAVLAIDELATRLLTTAAPQPSADPR